MDESGEDDGDLVGIDVDAHLFLELLGHGDAWIRVVRLATRGFEGGPAEGDAELLHQDDADTFFVVDVGEDFYPMRGGDDAAPARIGGRRLARDGDLDLDLRHRGPDGAFAVEQDDAAVVLDLERRGGGDGFAGCECGHGDLRFVEVS